MAATVTNRDMGHLSVQAIKGRFEQMQETSYPAVPPKSSPPYRGRPSFFPSTDPSPQLDSLLPLPEEEAARQTSNETGEPERWNFSKSRLRSRSVGNSSTVVGRNGTDFSTAHSHKDREQLCRLNLTTNLPQNDQSVNRENFSSFSEKQKLVESIVMNIKNSAAVAKKKEEEQKSKDFKVKKENLMNSSKFEKNLKNVLERGVRKKLNDKTIKEDDRPMRDSFLLEFHSKTDKQKHEQITNNSHKQKSHSKINSILGVDLYPIETYCSDGQERNYHYPIHKSRSSPVMLCKLKSANEESLQSTYLYDQQTNSPWDGTVDDSHEENTMNSLSQTPLKTELSKEVSPYPDQVPNSGGKIEKEIPVRPPRRRRVKKGRAPLPPLAPLDPIDDKNSPKTSDNLQNDTEELRDSPMDRETPIDNSTFFSFSIESTVNSPIETNKELTYEEECEQNLENVSCSNDNKDKRKVTLQDSLTLSECNEENDLFYNCKRMSSSEPTLDISSTSLPSGTPPKKPPRTFAHDIYRALKTEDQEEENAQLHPSPTKLTPSELESLYTKPIKRLKEKRRAPVDGLPPTSKSTSDLSRPKPTIAPKPTDIIHKAKQRLSVSEPLPSVAATKEYSGCKPSVKRNSSFRFSFRKHKKSSNSPPRAVQVIRPDNPLGKKLKIVSKNLQLKKNENEKKVRFHQECENKVIYDDVEGPIYAIPNTEEDSKKQSDTQEELHYMCSPLFQELSKGTTISSEEEENENVHQYSPSPERRSESKERRRIMDGLKEELRHSCRVVQKRFKGSAPSPRSRQLKR